MLSSTPQNAVPCSAVTTEASCKFTQEEIQQLFQAEIPLPAAQSNLLARELCRISEHQSEPIETAEALIDLLKINSDLSPHYYYHLTHAIKRLDQGPHTAQVISAAANSARLKESDSTLAGADLAFSVLRSSWRFFQAIPETDTCTRSAYSFGLDYVCELGTASDIHCYTQNAVNWTQPNGAYPYQRALDARLHILSGLLVNKYDLSGFNADINRILQLNGDTPALEIAAREVYLSAGNHHRSRALRYFSEHRCRREEVELLDVLTQTNQRKTTGMLIALALELFHEIQKSPEPQKLFKYIDHSLRSCIAQGEDSLRNFIYLRGRVKEREHLEVAHKLWGAEISGPQHPLFDHARDFLSFTKPFNADSLPWSATTSDKQPNPEYGRAYREVISANRLLRDLHFGFESYTFAARTNPGTGTRALTTFAQDIAGRAFTINASDITKFPGPGMMFSGLDLRRVLRVDQMEALLNREGDGLDRYRETWPFLAGEMSRISDTQFVFLRGMIALINPAPNLQFYGVPYAYVVLNEHFHNYDFQAGYLVPAEILMKKVSRCLMPATSNQNYSAEVPDITAINLTSAYLHVATKESEQHLLNVGWESNTAGFCNAFPPQSAPYHLWEAKTGAWIDHRDFRGHRHKAIIDGEFHGEYGITAEKDLLLEPLREAHHQVYSALNSYQRQFHLLQLAFSYWKKGLSDDLVSNRHHPGAHAKSSPEQKEELFTERSLRCLKEAYAWHHGLKAQGRNNPIDFPVLGIFPTLSCSAKPDSNFKLDTFDLSLNVNGKNFSLDPNGISTLEIQAWKALVVPRFDDSNNDPRFVNRILFD